MLHTTKHTSPGRTSASTTATSSSSSSSSSTTTTNNDSKLTNTTTNSKTTTTTTTTIKNDKQTISIVLAPEDKCVDTERDCKFSEWAAGPPSLPKRFSILILVFLFLFLSLFLFLLWYFSLPACLSIIFFGILILILMI